MPFGSHDMVINGTSFLLGLLQDAPYTQACVLRVLKTFQETGDDIPTEMLINQKLCNRERYSIAVQYIQLP